MAQTPPPPGAFAPWISRLSVHDSCKAVRDCCLYGEASPNRGEPPAVTSVCLIPLFWHVAEMIDSRLQGCTCQSPRPGHIPQILPHPTLFSAVPVLCCRLRSRPSGQRPIRSVSVHHRPRQRNPSKSFSYLPGRFCLTRGPRRPRGLCPRPRGNEEQQQRDADARPHGCDTVRGSCCLRHPYRVMPRGLYTLSTAVTSNTTRPPPA